MEIGRVLSEVIFYTISTQSVLTHPKCLLKAKGISEYLFVKVRCFLIKNRHLLILMNDLEWEVYLKS